MALRGNLRDFSLPDVFQLVTLSGKTGVLRIRRPDAEGSVWFNDGEIFFAQSDWHREALGTRLVTAGKTTANALSKALDIQRQEPDGGRRLGQILVDEGYISAKVLEAFVQEQIQDTIFDLLRWDEGDFDFETLDSVPDEDIGLSVSIENIVMEGSRRLEEWTRIKKKIPSMDIVFKMATAPGEGTFDISLKPTEWNLLLKIDGTRSVSELARDMGRTDFEVARIVYGLFSAGLLEVATDEEVERLRAERIEMEAAMAADDARRAKTSRAKVAAAVAEATDEPHVVEEPAFLSDAQKEATAEDLNVLEQLMDAVLEAPAPAPEPVVDEKPPAEAPAPDELPVAFETAVEEPVTQAPVEPAAEEPGLETTVEPAAEEPAEEEAVDSPAGSEIAASSAEVAVPEAAPPAPAEEVAAQAEDAALGSRSSPYVLEVAEQASIAPSVSDAASVNHTGDFAADLMALGLGELPAESEAELEPELVDATEAVLEIGPEAGPEDAQEGEPDLVEATEVELEIVPEVGLEDAQEVEPEPAAASSSQEPPTAAPMPDADMADLSDLLSTLAEAEDEEAAEVRQLQSVSELDELEVEGETGSAGVISTDPFLSDFGGRDVALSASLGDELTALTGGGNARTRPAASVSRIPDKSSDSLALKRDSQLDRELVMRIIEGVKNL